MRTVDRRGVTRRVASGVVLAIASLAAADACVITDPPGDFQGLPERPPTIIRSQVFPPATQIITRLPQLFLVPIELSDPQGRYYWAAFVDYNPAVDGAHVGSGFDLTGNGSRRQNLEIAIAESDAPPDRCHTIEIVVGIEPRDRSDARLIHTPEPPGGDSITWFYNPGGDPAGCPAMDAGIDAAPWDADTGGP
jgi:hypothetical protein